jgi:hypothetical protein
MSPRGSCRRVTSQARTSGTAISFTGTSGTGAGRTTTSAHTLAAPCTTTSAHALAAPCTSTPAHALAAPCTSTPAHALATLCTAAPDYGLTAPCITTTTGFTPEAGDRTSAYRDRAYRDRGYRTVGADRRCKAARFTTVGQPTEARWPHRHRPHRGGNPLNQRGSAPEPTTSLTAQFRRNR